MDNTYNTTEKIYQLLDDKKAQDLIVLSVKQITTLADYFIIATGSSSTHVKALSEHIEKTLSEQGTFVKHKEGQAKSEWILLDYNDIVVHIFDRNNRDYYGLERTWNDAEIIEF